MNRELLLLVDALAREKNVAKDIVFTALESALASATPFAPGNIPYMLSKLWFSA